MFASANLSFYHALLYYCDAFANELLFSDYTLKTQQHACSKPESQRYTAGVAHSLTYWAA
jgi:hypothetical protein